MGKNAATPQTKVCGASGLVCRVWWSAGISKRDIVAMWLLTKAPVPSHPVPSCPAFPPLTCSQVLDTSECLGRPLGNGAAGTPQSAPAEPGRPGWHGCPSAPASRGTAGTRCPLCSPISRCAGTGAGSRSRSGGSRRPGGGSGTAAD